MSNKYKDSPTWFVDPAIVKQSYVQSFDKEVYTNKFKLNPVIKHHHKVHINDKYAPAWKTIEFMTLGEVIYLFNAIKDQETKRAVSEHFEIRKLVVFNSYLSVIRTIRNHCAHGNILYDIALPTSIRRGPAGKMSELDYQRLHGAVKVIYYMTGIISKNRQRDLKEDLIKLFEKYHQVKEVQKTIEKATGIKNIGLILA